MSLTVDIVVVGINRDALATAVAAAQSGKRVLIITTSKGLRLRRRVREARRVAGLALSGHIKVLAGARVECVAGIRSVEAVLAMVIATGRRVDINAASIVTFEEESESETGDNLGDAG